MCQGSPINKMNCQYNGPFKLVINWLSERLAEFSKQNSRVKHYAHLSVKNGIFSLNQILHFLGITCPSLTAPKNGGIRFSNGLNVGSKASYTCQSGFILQGGVTRVCGSNGVWSGRDPICKRKLIFRIYESSLPIVCMTILY